MIRLATLLGSALILLVVTAAPRAARAQDPPRPGEQERAPEPRSYAYRQPCMGTLFQLTLYAADEIDANRAAKAAFDRVRALDAALSDYKPDSELNELCATSGTGAAVPVSADLWNVLKFSTTLCRKTGGAFDVTIGPLVKLWRRSRKTAVLPDAAALLGARDRVGNALVGLDEDGQRVTLKAVGMQLDLGGVAKGYALDAALRVLREEFGITRALIDGGGDVLAGDPPPRRAAWNVAVRNPREDGERWIVPLANAALATSGDLRQFVEIDGIRYSHIIDPSTGMGLTRRLQVSIIAPTGMEADALASAVSVLGENSGMAFIATRGQCEALVVSQVRDGARERRSRGFPPRSK